MQEYTIKPGAGIVVVKKINGEWMPLGLRALDGMLDIPKGVIDPGEDAFNAAVRETKEECGITNLDFIWGKDLLINSSSNGHITVYVAATNEEPTISINPHTGIKEHTNASWVSWEKLQSETYDFLVPCLGWARGLVEKSDD